jgi:hypothetical protein
MRADVLAVLKEYKQEILQNHEDFTDPDWWYYLHDMAINVHDYEGTGNVHVNLYDWFEDCGTVDMQGSYAFTLKEFADL